MSGTSVLPLTGESDEKKSRQNFHGKQHELLFGILWAFPKELTRTDLTPHWNALREECQQPAPLSLHLIREASHNPSTTRSLPCCRRHRGKLILADSKCLIVYLSTCLSHLHHLRQIIIVRLAFETHKLSLPYRLTPCLIPHAENSCHIRDRHLPELTVVDLWERSRDTESKGKHPWKRQGQRDVES